MPTTRRSSACHRRVGRAPGHLGVAVYVLLAAASGTRAATFVVDILSTDDPEATQIVVTPGARVPYAVVGEVFSDDETTPDNEGLASLTFDILTDFGIEQSPATELDPAVLAAFSFVTNLGTPVDDDITDIGGVPFDFTNPVTGVATGGPQVIVRGELVTPETEGTFHAAIAADGEAIVLLAPDPATEPFGSETATFDAGEGLTIITQADTTGGTDGGGTETPSTGNGNGSGSSIDIDPTTAVVGGGATILLAVLGALQFGPVGFVLGLFLGVISSLTMIFG